MPRYQILIDRSFKRPVHEVFGALADHNGMSQLFGARVKRVKDGQADLNGVGSVRHIGPPGRFGVQETVLGFVRDQRIHYRVTRGGAPMKNHNGQMQFESTNTGSRLRWQIDYDMPPVIGSIVRTVLMRTLKRGLRKLA
jgi:uncharacterized protein YndB with AHSA1/START domain